ncbi:regulatory GntR family protein [Actinomadura hallensis]|uniref:Regulatory GntR family protein n=1 Tax=Actinomadura hallensis TaxID=337895 RepID=A0A543IKS1_9ACTN|nr:regulatory GntR family protein [Actinomadura hallensis]
MPRQVRGGRAPATARRAFLAERAGVSTTTLDDARRQLLAPVPEGAFLARSAPRGSKRSVLHVVKRRPADTGERFAAVPAWTLGVLWAGRRRPAGMVSAEAWRLYAAITDKAACGNRSSAVDMTVGRLGALFGVSSCTARRRLAELEAAGLVEVTQRQGGWLSLLVSLTPDQATAAAAAFSQHGRRRISGQSDPSQVTALTPRRSQDTALENSGTPQESPSTDASPEEPPPLPAVGAYSNQDRAHGVVGGIFAGHRKRSRPPRHLVLDAAAVYRALSLFHLQSALVRWRQRTAWTRVVVRAGEQRSLRRTRQDLSVATACSTSARILA